MYKNILICAVFVFFALCVNVALSEMDYPQELKKEIAPYPKAKIVQTVKASETVMVNMEVSEKPDKIFEFYRKELETKGWTILGEIKQQGHSSLMGEKGSKNIVVNIADQSGKSMISLTLAPK
ncbi:MAG: hypothetical protein PVF38_03175 [Desulfobacterales bacterium]